MAWIHSSIGFLTALRSEILPHRVLFRKELRRCIVTCVTCKQVEKPSPSLSERAVKIDYDIYATKTNHLDLSPIVVLHKLGGSRQEWKDICNELNLRTGRKVIVYDAVNHGTSTRHNSMTYGHMAFDLLILLEKLKINKITCVGHQMGGKTVMTFALTQPKRIDQLVVLDAFPARKSCVIGSVNKLSNVEKQEIKSCKTKEKVIRILEQLELEETFHKSLCDSIIQTEQEMKHNVDINSVLESHDEIQSFPSFIEKVLYPNPCLFVTDERDLKSTDHGSIYTRFPKAEIKCIENCNPMIHVEQPEVVLDVLTEYLMGTAEKQ